VHLLARQIADGRVRSTLGDATHDLLVPTGRGGVAHQRVEGDAASRAVRTLGENVQNPHRRSMAHISPRLLLDPFDRRLP